MSMLPELQTWLDEAAVRHGVPGAAVAVGQGDELAEAATGVLNRETGVPTTPDSVFQIGSVTKVWTAALVMELVDEGLVELDEPVRRYLPAFAVVDPAATETVTVRQLLLHTGGFDGDLFEDTGRGDDALDRYLTYLGGNATQVTPPGAHYSYSNSGYAVLGALIAKLRGKSWESVLRERLIEPLGLKHMALLPEEAILFRASAGHSPAGEVMRPWQLCYSLAPVGATPCAAPRALVRFGRMFLTGDGPLSASTIATMTAPQITLPGVPERGEIGRGLGPSLFDWCGTAAFGHNGSTIGQVTQWRVVPDHDLVFAISANGDASTPLLDDMLDAVVHELTGLTVPARPAPPAGPHEPGPAHYAGRYEFPLATYDVAATGDGLDVTATPRSVAALGGEGPTTEGYVALAGSTFVTVRPVHGLHSTFTFLDDGRYLYGGRIAARV